MFFTHRQISLFALLLAGLSTLHLAAQPANTPADARLKALDQRSQLAAQSQLSALKTTSIGPSIFSCRVTDVEANPTDPTEMYVAYASGGLWYTHSNATQFKPLFDQQASMTIGDIAVDWSHNIVWVGTGEANSSRSSYAGTGMYRSADGGKTWDWRGLPESHHISRIILHPTNPDVLWVAVLGHLYTSNAERGVYKTTDGGKNWSKVLYVNDISGAIDLVIDPLNPDVLYAATWQRERSAWNFSGAGEGSGIWKSTDGGNNWSLLSTTDSGFPTGKAIGRIGLCAGLKDGKTVLYASVDNQNLKTAKDKSKNGDALTKDQLRTMTKVEFGKLAEDKLADFLKANNFPEQYNAKKVKNMVETDKIQPITLVEFLEDANNNLFETDYIGAEVYRSDDNGKSWKQTQTALEQINFTYGYYFSNIRCNPVNADEVYLMGFLIIHSEDGGHNWENINGDNVHVDHHALWVNPSRKGHIINGNDGGLNISWDNGKSWMKCNNPPVGQFYAINVDDADPYNVYGGAQDNGVWTGPSTYEANTQWHQGGKYPYKELMGGDGMQVQVDTRNNNIVYTGYQFGNYFRINKTTGSQIYITPKHDLGERPLRFNWQTPIWLSVHNQDILYFGANKLYRSLDRGDHWTAISGDLTGGGHQGNVPYGTLTSIHESPLKFGLLYAGSDDGFVHVSKDGGESWTKISDNLPQKLWVSRVQASAHERARVYVSLNGYRWDNFTAYLYVSEDYGQTWNRLGLDLPDEPVNVVKEDPSNPNILYVGTDHGLYVSLDRGKSFQTLDPEFPDAPVHDLVVQAKMHDLVIGTHGRSMFKVDVSKLQQMTPDLMKEVVHAFEPGNKKLARGWGQKQPYQAIKEPEFPVTVYAATAGKINWSVATKEGNIVLNSGSITGVKGLNVLNYHLDVQEEVLKKYREWLQKDLKKPLDYNKADSGKWYLRKGVYMIVFEKEGLKSSQEFTIE